MYCMYVTNLTCVRLLIAVYLRVVCLMIDTYILLWEYLPLDTYILYGRATIVPILSYKLLTWESYHALYLYLFENLLHIFYMGELT